VRVAALGPLWLAAALLARPLAAAPDAERVVQPGVQQEPAALVSPATPSAPSIRVTATLSAAQASAVAPVVVRPVNDPYLGSRDSWSQGGADQWGLYRIGLYRDGGFAQVDPDGFADPLEPVRVALIDSGVDYSHPDLGVAALWRNPDEQPNGRDDDGNGLIDDLIGWNFVDDNNNPWDDHGHGTHIAGIIAAGRDNATGIAGIAPNARLMVLKVVDASGNASGSHIAQALRYAADKGAQLIQLSLGGQAPGPAERDALAYAVAREAVVVIAAGNRASGDPQHGYAALPGVLVVGALAPNGERAPFSDWGPNLDLLAPGVDILSLRASGSDFLRHNGAPDYRPGSAIVGAHYYRATGSSFAAPFVTGVAALILGRDPWMEPPQLLRVLRQSARDLGPVGVDQNHGYGQLDALAALAAPPQHFVEARLQRVLVDQQRQLQLIGTADADQFLQAQIDVGVGEQPTAWQPLLAEPLLEPRRAEPLARIDSGRLPPGQLLTLRLQVYHRDGALRESRLQLLLPGATP